MLEAKNNFKPVIWGTLLSLLITKLPFTKLIFFPFSMFVTYVHETNHGLVALLTGGSLISFTMQMDTSGLAYTQGGIRFLILSAGYVGSTIWGGLLLIASLKKKSYKPLLSILSIFFLIFTLLYARNFVAFGSGLFFSALLFLFSNLKNNNFTSIFIGFLAVQTSFNSISDIYDLLFLSKTCARTDAHLMSQEMTGGLIPPIIFATIWALIAGILFFIILKKALKTKI